MSTVSELRPLDILPGVEPNTDATALQTRHYIFADKIRFVKGLPEKLGGWIAAAYTGSTLSGYVRAIFGLTSSMQDYCIIGSNTKLFAMIGGVNNDITPAGLPPGAVDETAQSGYGAGLYGVGLYGASLTSSTARSYPRTWFFDRFGSLLIATPGNQTGIYSWAGSTATPPALVANAPTAVNYAFVSDNILVTFGADGVQNRIRSSDQGNITNWTSSSTNQVYAYDVANAGRLVSHVPVTGKNLIFTERKTYTFRYIGLPFIWETKELDPSIGIIGPMARCNVEGTAYWMGQNNFYMYDGGNVRVIPSNTSPQSTLLRYVYNNLNYAQKSKCFAWYNQQFNEVWFHYPRGSSLEPNAIARLALDDYSWTPDTMDRTAAEYPNQSYQYPRLCSLLPKLYYHEYGANDDTSSLPFSLRTCRITGGKKPAFIQGVIPDSTQTGDITIQVQGRLFPSSASLTTDITLPVTPATERLQWQPSARYWSYVVRGNALDQVWRAGAWQEDLQPMGNE